MEENKKEVLISVKVDNQDAINATDQLKNKYKQLTDQALAFDSIDYDNASIGDLRDHLLQANNVLKQLKTSGLATEQQLADMGKTISQLKNNIAGLKIENVFKGAEASVKGVVGTAMILEGGMKSLGIESENVAKSIERMLALQNLADGVKNLSEYASGMKALMVSTTGATGAMALLRVALASIGIGLVISAVVYLTNNWKSLSKTISEFLPEFDGVTKYFKNIVPIMEGVGKAIIGFVVRPIQGVIKSIQLLTKGEFKQAGLELIDALNPVNRIKNIVEDFKSGYAQGIINANKNKNEEVKKDNTKANTDLLNEQKRLAEEQKKLIDEVYNYIVQANRDIENANKSARQKELDDLDLFYQSQLKKAEELNTDTSAILEAKRIKALEINKKYDNEELKLAKEAKEKALQDGLNTAQTQGQTAVLNAEVNNDSSTTSGLSSIANAKLEALKSEYEAEQLLYKDNKDKLAFLDAQYAKNKKDIETTLKNEVIELAKQEAEDKAILKENELAVASSIAGALLSLASENTAVGKALAVAQATIDTYAGASKALAQGGFLGIGMASAVIIQGLANVKKILSTKVEGDKGGGINTTAPIQAPTINTTQLALRQTQDVRVIANNTEQQPLVAKAFIVNKDLQSNSDKENFYKSVSTL